MQSSLNGRLRFTDRLGVNLSGSGLMNMREQPGLAAWFDSLDVASMLSSTGAIVAAGEAVALWSDRSGNSNANGFYSNGVSGNTATIPDFSFTSPSNDVIVATAKIAPALWSPVAEGVVFAKGASLSVAANLECAMTVYTDGKVRFYWSDGSVVASTSSSVLSGTDMAPLWVRVTLSLDYSGGTLGQGGWVSTWEKSTNGTTWTAAGGDTYDYPGFGPNSAYEIQNGTNVFTFSALTGGTTSLLAGFNYYTKITTGGTTDLLVDFTAAAKLATSFTCASGQTVTINSTGATGARISGARDLYQGTAANRPIYLPWSGSNYGWLNGVAGNYFSTPSAAALQLGATFCLVWEGTLDDWTPGTANTLIGKYSTTDNKRQYNLTITTAGAIAVSVSSDGGGANLTTLVSSATLGLTDRTKKAIRVDYVGAGATARFYTAASRLGPWTELGTEQSGTARTPFSSDTPLLVGGATAGTVQPHSGNTYYAAAIEGTFAAGTVVADFNPSLYTSGSTFTAATGEVWTINGGAHIVTRTGLYFDGANDYLKTAAFSLSQPETVYFGGEQVSYTANDGILEGGTSNSLTFYQGGASGRLVIFTGASSGVVLNGTPIKTPSVYTAVFNSTNSALRLNRALASAGDSGTSAANGITIGSNWNGTATFGNITVSELAILSVAHTTAQQDSIALYAGAKWRFST